MKQISKIISIITVITVVSLMYVSFIGVNQDISKVFEAIEIQDEFKETTVKLEGTLTKRLFLSDTFKGKIEVAGYEWSDATFQHLTEGEEHIIQGIMNVKESSNVIDVIFYVTSDFSQIELHHNDNDSIIVGPATTKEEAQAIDLATQYMGQ